MNDAVPHPRAARPAILLARTLIGLGLALTGLHAWFHLTWRGMHGTDADLLRWTDVRWDLGPFSWVSWLAFGSVGVVAWRAGAGRPPREQRGWRVTGALFVYLALDDALTVHEHVSALVENAWPGLLVYGWLLVVLPVLVAAGLASFAFLRRACWHDRVRRWQLLAGFGCLGAAVLLELVERPLHASDLRHRGFLLTDYQQTIEELLELLGPAILLCCVARLRAAQDVMPEP